MAAKLSYYIEAPVESVFDFMKDPGKTADIGPFTLEVPEVKMTKEGIGTYMSWRTKIAGVVPVEGFDVFTDVVSNKRIVEKSSNAMVGTWEYTFEPEGSGTKLTMEHRPRSLWGVPPLKQLVDYGTVRMSRLYADELKSRIEAEAALPSQRKPTASKPRKRAASR